MAQESGAANFQTSRLLADVSYPEKVVSLDNISEMCALFLVSDGVAGISRAKGFPSFDVLVSSIQPRAPTLYSEFILMNFTIPLLNVISDEIKPAQAKVWERKFAGNGKCISCLAFKTIDVLWFRCKRFQLQKETHESRLIFVSWKRSASELAANRRPVGSANSWSRETAKFARRHRVCPSSSNVSLFESNVQIYKHI